MSDQETREGGCRCGAVRYRVIGPTVWSAGCCCRDCARASGTPFIVWVGFAPENVEFMTGKPTIHVSSEGVLRGFCADCGASMTYGRDSAYDTDEPILYVSAATLDDHDAFPPTEVVWYSQRPAWFSLEGDIPLHDGISPDHADRAYSEALKRQ